MSSPGTATRLCGVAALRSEPRRTAAFTRPGKARAVPPLRVLLAGATPPGSAWPCTMKVMGPCCSSFMVGFLPAGLQGASIGAKPGTGKLGRLLI